MLSCCCWFLSQSSRFSPFRALAMSSSLSSMESPRPLDGFLAWFLWPGVLPWKTAGIICGTPLRKEGTPNVWSSHAVVPYILLRCCYKLRYLWKIADVETTEALRTVYLSLYNSFPNHICILDSSDVDPLIQIEQTWSIVVGSGRGRTWSTLKSFNMINSDYYIAKTIMDWPQFGTFISEIGILSQSGWVCAHF